MKYRRLTKIDAGKYRILVIAGNMRRLAILSSLIQELYLYKIITGMKTTVLFTLSMFLWQRCGLYDRRSTNPVLGLFIRSCLIHAKWNVTHAHRPEPFSLCRW